MTGETGYCPGAADGLDLSQVLTLTMLVMLVLWLLGCAISGHLAELEGGKE